MTAQTTITFSLADQLGQQSAGARVQYQLDRPDIDDATGQVIQPRPGQAEADANGEGQFTAWPNERGRRASQYRVDVFAAGRNRPVWSFKITVPEAGPVNLTAIITEDPFPEVSASQVALQEAQAAAAVAASHADDAEQAATAAAASATAASGDATASAAARTAAEQAQTAAEAARDAAQAAQAAAESARDDSTTARDAAQAAQSAAEQAQTASEAARDAAQAAQTAAETARDAAQLAQTGSETARDEAQTARDQAQAAAATIPDPTNQDAGLVPQTDGAGGYGLVDRFGASDLGDPAVHSQSVLAGVLLPPIDSNYGPFLWGRMSAPASGQTPQAAVGDMQWVYPISLYGSLSRTLEIRGRTRNTGAGAAENFVGLIVDENNWYEVGWARNMTIVRECVSGVVTQIASAPQESTGISSADMFDYFSFKLGRGSGTVMFINEGLLNNSHSFPNQGFALSSVTAIGFGAPADREAESYVAVFGNHVSSL